MNRERRMTKYGAGSLGRGFTIVELLVVIAVIAILMGLLLPAIQAARESGRRTACMSNAYQLGMAVNRFDQDKGRVPRWQDSISAKPLYVSWTVAVLPYIERNDLYDLWAAGTAAGSRVNLFLCPSSPPDNSNAVAYAGNAGDGSATFANGVMPPLGGSYSLEDVADGDGTATTLLFAERSGSSNQKLWTYPGSTAQQALSSSFPFFGHSAVLPDRDSLHVDGAVVAFCDGHTYFLGSNVSGNVLTQLITSRNSGASTTPVNYRKPVLNDSDY
jgi:prepilin-type N-terminal cleavage/methylation domain-containing protein/prepilin-type processing-associated H-X9-DG protein